MEECCAMVPAGQHFGPSLCPTAAAQDRFGPNEPRRSWFQLACYKRASPAVGWIDLAMASGFAAIGSGVGSGSEPRHNGSTCGSNRAVQWVEPRVSYGGSNRGLNRGFFCSALNSRIIMSCTTTFCKYGVMVIRAHGEDYS